MQLSDFLPQAEPLWLSVRERQVLALVCRARSNKEIAHALHCSEATVKFNVSALFKKLEVSNRDELLVWGLQHPQDLLRGYTRSVGLHEDGCECGGSYCATMLPIDIAA